MHLLFKWIFDLIILWWITKWPSEIPTACPSDSHGICKIYSSPITKEASISLLAVYHSYLLISSFISFTSLVGFPVQGGHSERLSLFAWKWKQPLVANATKECLGQRLHFARARCSLCHQWKWGHWKYCRESWEGFIRSYWEKQTQWYGHKGKPLILRMVLI